MHSPVSLTASAVRGAGDVSSLRAQCADDNLFGGVWLDGAGIYQSADPKASHPCTCFDRSLIGTCTVFGQSPGLITARVATGTGAAAIVCTSDATSFSARPCGSPFPRLAFGSFTCDLLAFWNRLNAFRNGAAHTRLSLFIFGSRNSFFFVTIGLLSRSSGACESAL